MNLYKRTENGGTTWVNQAEGRAEINHAMMGGKRQVRTMSQITRTDFLIEYKDGRTVRLVLAEAAEAPAAPAEPEWSTASASMLLHRFTGQEDPKHRRALCNKGFRPHRYGNGYSFQTVAERSAGQYADLYTYCGRCEGK